MNRLLLLLTLLVISGCQVPAGNSEDAIRRVDDCVCYRSVEGQQLKPWELAWKDPARLRQQVSHCVCKVEIDLKKVKDPGRYVVPGTLVQ